MTKSVQSRILVVEDSLTVRMDLRQALTAAGFSVTLCGSKAEAEKELKTGAFGLVILDVVLPDGDGIDLLRWLTTDSQWSATPVIVLSSAAEVHDRLRGLKTGAVEYIGKPYDPGYLVRCALERTGVDADGLMQMQRGVGGKKILAVDDNTTFLKDLAARLRHDRHEVVVARSGEQALEILALDPVDCILIDLVLPGIDGMETCRRIKTMPARKDIPIIMLTASDDREVRAKGIALGVDDFIVKYGKLDVVRARVRAALRKSRVKHGRSPDSGKGRALPEHQKISFFEQIAAVSGLPSQLARSMIEQCCKCTNVYKITPAHVLQALPSIREALSAHFSPEETAKRVGAVAAMARLAEGREGPG
jgi:DNA-binding response OmpR family regulator